MTDLTQIAIDLDPEDRRSFRRVLVFSAVVHVAGFIALALVPSIPTVSPPAAIAVSLVAPPAARPAPRAPAPPAAKPTPRPPKPAPVVLPTEATVPKPKPRVKPRPEPRVEPAPAIPAEQTQDYTDVLASLRQEAGEQAPRPAAEAAPTAVAPAGAGPGVPVSPELRAWMTKARIRIKDNWVVPASFRMAAIVAEVRIQVGPGGNLVGEPRLVAGSGNPYYDDGVLRSIRKADPLPPPPEPGQWTFRFVSDEF